MKKESAKSGKMAKRPGGPKKTLYIGLGALILLVGAFFVIPSKTKEGITRRVTPVTPSAPARPVMVAKTFSAGSLRESLKDTSSKGRTDWMVAGGTIVTVYLPTHAIRGTGKSVSDSIAESAKNRTMPDSIHFRTEQIDSVGGRIIAQIPKTGRLEWPIWVAEGRKGRKIAMGMAGFSSVLKASDELK